MAKLWCTSFMGFKNIVDANKWNNYNIPDNVAIISICNSNYKEVFDNTYYFEKHLLKDSYNIININFDDILDYTINDPEHKYHNVKGLTDEQAKTLFTFIENNLGKDIYVHCSAGVSRSQGIVKFILDCYPDYYGEKDTNPDNKCDFPNLHVVSLLKKLYRKKYYKIDE